MIFYNDRPALSAAFDSVTKCLVDNGARYIWLQDPTIWHFFHETIIAESLNIRWNSTEVKLFTSSFNDQFILIEIKGKPSSLSKRCECKQPLQYWINKLVEYLQGIEDRITANKCKNVYCIENVYVFRVVVQKPRIFRNKEL